MHLLISQHHGDFSSSYIILLLFLEALFEFASFPKPTKLFKAERNLKQKSFSQWLKNWKGELGF